MPLTGCLSASEASPTVLHTPLSSRPSFRGPRQSQDKLWPTSPHSESPSLMSSDAESRLGLDAQEALLCSTPTCLLHAGQAAWLASMQKTAALACSMRWQLAHTLQLSAPLIFPQLCSTKDTGSS